MAKSIRLYNCGASSHSRGRRAPSVRNDRGIALIISLMLLTLMSVMSLIMVLTVSPDMLINGYYGNFRGSFYASDSGLNIARQQLINQIETYVNMNVCPGWSGTTGNCAAPPLATSNAGTVISNVLSTYGSFTSLNSGQAATSWPGNFQIVNTSACPSTFSPVAGTGTGSNPNAAGQYTTYTYKFNYQICSQGRAQGSQQVYTTEYGVINLVINAYATPTRTASFAAFGGFVSNYPPNDAPLVPGIFEGPMFTNGAWQFGTGGAYTFTGPVGQVSPNVDYDINGNWYDEPDASYTVGGVKIAPNFEGGLNLGQPALALPPNDFSQKWAVLDGVGCGEGGSTCGSGLPPAPTNAQLNSYLRDINANAYPSGGTSSGVFLPYTCSGSNCSTAIMNGGGIYVEGSASVGLTMGTDTNGNLTQTYAITQGSTTTTITIPVWNPTSNTVPSGSNAYTKIVSGGTTKTLSGVPMNNIVSASPTEGTLLYVDGNINGLSGPSQGQASIQDNAQVTIVANGDVNLTGDIIYAHERNNLTTADDVIPANANYTTVLGVFTASGNINLSSPYSNNNLHVDGALAAVGSSCASNSCGFTLTGHSTECPSCSSYINTFTNYGAQSQVNIFGANMTSQQQYYDALFAAGSGPPWFPSTVVNSGDISLSPPSVIATASRMSWNTTPQ